MYLGGADRVLLIFLILLEVMSAALYFFCKARIHMLMRIMGQAEFDANAQPDVVWKIVRWRRVEPYIRLLPTIMMCLVFGILAVWVSFRR